MTTLTHELATSGQIKQLNRMATDAVEKAVEAYTDANYLSKQGAERVKGNADFSARIHAATVLALTELSNSDKYADEEVSSNYGYLSGYTCAHPLEQQLSRLKELYPQFSHVTGLSAQGRDINEGHFLVPNVWKKDSLLTGTYNDSVVQMLKLVEKDRNGNFSNYRDGQLGPERLRQSARAEAAWKKISSDQGHPDILVIAAQFGITHRGRSVRRAREVMVDQNQFGLGAFAVGIMILTHPDRLKHLDDLWIDCAGDEFDDPDADARFVHAPHFKFGGGKVLFYTRWSTYAYVSYGSASGVLPQ